MDNSIVPDSGNTNNSLSNLAVARRYLAEKATMCAKAAKSANPQEVWLAVELSENRGGVRDRRSREVFMLECYNCHREIEITVGERHCPHCRVPLEIQWAGAR
jgi:hypothetical protein